MPLRPQSKRGERGAGTTFLLGEIHPTRRAGRTGDCQGSAVNRGLLSLFSWFLRIRGHLKTEKGEFTGPISRVLRFTSLFLSPRSVLLWYDKSMIPKLTEEMRQALEQQSAGPVEISDDRSQRVYVLIDAELHQRAMTALQQQQDWESIQRGIAEADAVEGISLEEADSRGRDEGSGGSKFNFAAHHA